MGGGSGGGIGSGVGTGIMTNCRMPEILAQPLPDYTEEARKARVEGTVVLTGVVRRDGTMDQIKVARGLGYGLDDSAIRTVMSKWRFRPATCNGQPTDYPATIEAGFHIF
jgi:TonB family protein